MNYRVQIKTRKSTYDNIHIYINVVLTTYLFLCLIIDIHLVSFTLVHRCFREFHFTGEITHK